MTFLASLGRRLMQYQLDGQGALQPVGELELPSPIHYVWPHPQRRVLYAVCSSRWIEARDEGHLLAAIEVPAGGGAMRLLGPPVALPTRALHVTVDPSAAHAVVTFNAPAGVQVHALAPDGALAGVVPQRHRLELGQFPHQARFFPCGRWLLVVDRGNNAHAGRAEDPGSLRRFAFRDGQLEPVQVVAPDGGLGFGPRHLDFHPTLPCIYVSVERQSQLQVYHHQDGVLEPRPRQVWSTLAPGKQPAFEQFGGPIHVDPAGRWVHVANRDDPHPGKEASHLTGDNTLASFRIDPADGSVSAPVHSELDAYHVRTFSLQLPFLVAASQMEVSLPTAAGEQRVPASLGVFRVMEDGALVPAHRRFMPAGSPMLFWCGFVRAYGAAWG